MKKYGRTYVVLIARGVLVLTLLWLASGCAAPHVTTAPDKPTAAVPGISESLGIEVVAIRRSAAGYMLDFRYRVVDGDKAAVMTNNKVKPYLIHEATGARFAVPSSPKVGPLRQTTRNVIPESGRIYFMIFANPGQYVKAGEMVTVIVGEHRIEHLKVE